MTIAVVLIYVSGLSSATVGTLLLLSRYQVAPDSVLPTSLLGAAVILFGLLTLAVGSGVSRGRRLARVLVSIYLAIQLVLHIVTVITTDEWDWTAIAIIVAELFTAIALWAPPGAGYFREAAATDAAAIDRAT